MQAVSKPGAQSSFQTVGAPQQPSPAAKPAAKPAGKMPETVVAAKAAVKEAEGEKRSEEPNLTNEENLTLAKLELGTDYTATVTLSGFMFKIHYPSMLEDQMIMVAEERQYEGVQKPSPNLRLTAAVWATLEVVVDEIWKISGEAKPRRIDGNFPIVFKTMRNANKVYKDVVLPLYSKYLELESKLDEEVDPLKNV